MTTRDWADRFRAPRWSLPGWARDAPDRLALTGNHTGVREVYSWAPGTEPVQATSRNNGTLHAALPPDGAQLWWFADTDGDEFGVWRRQPWGSGPGSDSPAAPGVPAGYPAGLLLGRDGQAVVGTSDDAGSVLHRITADGATPETLYQHEQDASADALSRDGELVVIGHSERGDSRHPALRVVRFADGGTVAELDDGPGLGVHAIGFLGDTHQLLVGHERNKRDELLILDVDTGRATELLIEVPGEISAVRSPDGVWLLIAAEFRGRTKLYRYEIARGVLANLPSDTGVVDDAAIRPDGSVWMSWSSAASPPVCRDLAGAVLVPQPAGSVVAPPSVPVSDVTADGPGGRVPAFLQEPAGERPYATVFLVHGGPTHNDSDSWYPAAAAWVDAGYAVVQVNYRGSTGYGKVWRDAIEASPGLVELADVAAVREQLVDEGIVDPARCILAGGSWGGFLTLLGVGTQPELWAAGSAAVPVADYVAAYEDEMEGLKAFDRSLFGGSPTEVPERYRVASPLTYVEAVRAPLLVLAGANDPRCPIRQIDNYLAALDGLGTAYEVYRFDAGHGSVVVDERVRQMQVELDFVTGAVPS